LFSLFILPLFTTITCSATPGFKYITIDVNVTLAFLLATLKVISYPHVQDPIPTFFNTYKCLFYILVY